ncbi:protein SDA1 homolog [Trichonephila clavipes]|nr:protein SDA1 homolog [Trichonephila clavipes]
MKEISTTRFNYSILQLQNLIKRDPPSYYEEFQTYYQHFLALFELIELNPQEYSDNFADVVHFLAQVSSCYTEDLKDFPEKLKKILKENGTVLDPLMRLCLVKALILMRNRDVLLPTDLIALFFELLRCKDKILRQLLQTHIVNDLKRINCKHKNVKVNTALQNFIYSMLSDNHVTAARMSLEIMIELYRRDIWRDAKTVNTIATACFSKDKKILVKALQFFLNIEEEINEKDSDSEDEATILKEVVTANLRNKKSRKRAKILEKTKKVLKKSKKHKLDQENCNFAAIHLLNDPLGLAEKLFGMLQKFNKGFQIKLLLMNLTSRLIGINELMLLNFYPYLQRYLRPHQIDVTKILLCAAQATHEHVPPDTMAMLIKEILNNFVSEKNSPEGVAVGINAIREICARCPLAMDTDCLDDLAQYKKFKNKNVTEAAKSIINLFREINPKMLKRKFKIRPTEAVKELSERNFEYGALNAKSYIPGTEVLPINPSTTNADDDKIVEVENAKDSDGWIDVSHSEDEVYFDKDDDEKEDEKKEKEGEKKEKEDESAKPDESSSDKSDAADIGKSEEEEETLTAEEIKTIKAKAETISQSRILSEAEFVRIKAAQLSKKVTYAKGKKRTAVTLSEPVTENPEIVSLNDIERLAKKPKATKEERIASIMEGREGREKFGKKKQKSEFASKTQKQNDKNKAFMMIKHKVRSKVKRSFRDKQLALKKSMLKQKRRKH